MATLAAPRESDLPPIALKKLPREARMVLLDILHMYWNADLDDNPEWNQEACYACILVKKKVNKMT
jgi:hypothetical protein